MELNDPSAGWFVPSRLASTKGWPKLRFAGAFEQAHCFEAGTHVCLVFTPEHSGIGEIGGNRSDPQPLHRPFLIFFLSEEANALGWGEADSSFLCVS